MSTNEEDYCPVCQSCGEDERCSIETSIIQHGCKYADYYARQAYYDKMIIDEFHNLAEQLGLCRDETGNEVIDPIGDLYDRACKRVESKYEMKDQNKKPPYPIGDLTPEEIEQLKQSKKEIAARVKELWDREMQTDFMRAQGAHMFNNTDK